MSSTLFKQILSLGLLSAVSALPDNVFRFTPENIADISSLNTFTSANATNAQFQVYDDAFLTILGNTPTMSLILNSTNATFTQFHEAAALVSSNPPVLFVTSNQYNFTGINSPDTSNKTVVISRVSQNNATGQWTAEVINTTGTTVHLANGATVGNDGNLIYCAQGDLKNGGALLTISPTAPFKTTNLLNSYLGTPFNSPNDVVQTKDGAVWFTDPQFGFAQNIRSAPALPAQVYRWVPGTTDIRVVAQNIVAPNGIAFSPDEKIAYVTDTNATLPFATQNIYAYDVINSTSSPILANKRTFAMPSNGIPDGIKVDAAGNVYSGCGDGINVWNAQGKLLGKMIVSGGSSNFALGANGQVFILNETKLWLATLGGLKTISSTAA
ncbi:hypothetical protein BP5796_06260 [Coleophoma crateriformis]|uniref:SMP-30/Gluconolactonase/LRE-like region domain-containing protein n=1 Tax=Coleophoma crateriformis TaxID=565419 RepID=A0A3D8RWM6_9HELO|nr:hypothetical protein BP5796_06260 [Coleophoma crateriformis]